MAKFFIQRAIHPNRRGALRRKLGVKKGQNISPARLAALIVRLRSKARAGKLTMLERRTLQQAILARNLREFSNRRRT
jgi:3-deoxy-D-arabino-heptulosonate 7-phosphate (DAHP) synthase class II